MPQNLEIKARISSLAKSTRIAHQLPCRDKGILLQKDIYYRIPRGRLKLRILNAERAELIYYRRPNRKNVRLSEFTVSPVTNWERTDRFLKLIFQFQVMVNKTRKLFFYKNARIHIDKVSGLGSYIEFEVMVTKGVVQAKTLMKFLMEYFHIKREDLVAGSYSDLLIRKRKRRNCIR